MNVSVNLVVAALVLWAVCVTLWMMVLSIRGSWTSTHCWNDRERKLPQFGENITRSSAHQEIEDYHLKSTTSETLVSSTPHPLLAKQLLYYSKQIKEIKSERENCTMVIVTYRRQGLLSKLLNHYCRISVLQRILVIWNDNSTKIPGTTLTWTNRCKVELKLIAADSNKLTNRYIPREEIETDCKYLLEGAGYIISYHFLFFFLRRLLDGR